MSQRRDGQRSPEGPGPSVPCGEGSHRCAGEPGRSGPGQRSALQGEPFLPHLSWVSELLKHVFTGAGETRPPRKVWTLTN